MNTTAFKKSLLFFTLFAAFAMIFTGCKKNEDKDPEPTPSPTIYKIYYKVSNHDAQSQHTASDCFHFNISYKDADGNMVTVNNAEMPWAKTITVTLPFEAILEGSITYDEADMPDEVCFVSGHQISISPNTPLETIHHHGTKEDIIQMLNNYPFDLVFTHTFTYNINY